MILFPNTSKGIVSITNIYRVAHTPVKMQVLTAVSIPNGADARALFICCCFFVTSCLPQNFFFASSPFLNGIEWDPNFIFKRYRKKFSRGKFA